MMNYPYAYLALLATLALAGCSTDNPLFAVSSASDPGGGTGGAESTGAPPTGDPATSTPATDGTETNVTSTSMTSMTSLPDTDPSQTATSVEPGTVGSSDVGNDTGSSSSNGPGGDSSGEGMCGDGNIDVPNEECDDGNLNAGDGCSAECITEVPVFCGNGKLDGNEECDDGNGVDGDACTNACHNPVCGDKIVQQGVEECDFGQENKDDGACTSGCKKAVCGDGLPFPGGGEQCDAGPNNGDLGFCNEECSGLVVPDPLTIRVVAGFTGNLNVGTGIAGGDLACSKYGNYKIMAVDGVNRVASKTGNNNDGQTKWALAPHRLYVNEANQPIFITGTEALLGVRKGVTMQLVNPIGLGATVWTGLNKDWTANELTCGKWTTIDGSGGTGLADKKDTTSISNGAKACSTKFSIYCVEQPAG